MSGRNKCALLLTLGSFFLLIPGLFYPMLSLTIDGGLDSNVGQFSMKILEKNSSIMATIGELKDNQMFLVAFLIFLFSVLVPFLKGVLLITALVIKKTDVQGKIFSFIKAIGKWSMADVFVVAIFLAYLSTRGHPSVSHHQFQVFGFSLKLKAELSMISELGPGFWYFLGYCMVSLTGLQIARVDRPESNAQT